MSDRRAALPKVDRVLAHPSLRSARERLGDTVTSFVRTVIDEARAAAGNGAPAIDEHEAARRTAARAMAWEARRTRRVINATGVILHTNLGRAPLSPAATLAIATTASGYLSIEIDLATGRRGGRAKFVEDALTTLTGAEAALVVNNNAAAVLLALAATALGRTVLVSRGELVEIGGGFRVPEVLARSGARLVEVGTTNRTRVSDYASALSTEVGAILRVHPGNFRQTGFVERPALAELVALGRAHGIPIVEDLGGGALVDLAADGLAGDPLVSSSIAAGADIVTFSTDKILGGPQGGVLAGTRVLIDRARRDPLARALRLGRLPLVALEATLASYLAGAFDDVPALRAVMRREVELEARARRWASALGLDDTSVRRTTAVAGGGTYAEERLPSWALGLPTDDADGLIARLRLGTPSVVARIEDGAVLFDARTVLDHEDDALLDAIRTATAIAR